MEAASSITTDVNINVTAYTLLLISTIDINVPNEKAVVFHFQDVMQFKVITTIPHKDAELFLHHQHASPHPPQCPGKSSNIKFAKISHRKLK